MCVYRARKFAKKPDQHEMMSGDGPLPKATRGRVHIPKIQQPLEKQNRPAHQTYQSFERMVGTPSPGLAIADLDAFYLAYQ
jgi:hypothetical protein